MSRIAFNEDTLRDLAGYCILLLTEMRARHGE